MCHAGGLCGVMENVIGEVQEALCVGENGSVVVILFFEESLLDEKAVDLLGDVAREACGCLLVGGLGCVKLETPGGFDLVNSIKNNNMEVKMKVSGRSKPLHKHDGACEPVCDARLAPLVTGDGRHDFFTHLGGGGFRAGEPQSELNREGHHKLTNRHQR